MTNFELVLEWLEATYSKIEKNIADNIYVADDSDGELAFLSVRLVRDFPEQIDLLAPYYIRLGAIIDKLQNNKDNFVRIDPPVTETRHIDGARYTRNFAVLGTAKVTPYMLHIISLTKIDGSGISLKDATLGNEVRFNS